MLHFNRIVTAIAIGGGMTMAAATSGLLNTSNQQFDDPMEFEYVAPPITASNPDPYSQDNVENLANWHYTSTDPGCSSGNIKACAIHVSPSHVLGTDPSNYTLDPSFVISASSGTTSHVTGTSDGTQPSNFTNRGQL